VVAADNTTGAWTLTPATALSQGLLQLKARAVDAAGNAGPYSPPRSVTIDSIAPVTTLSPAPATPTQASSLTFTFSADDPLAVFACSLDAQPFVPCSSPWTTPQLGEGGHGVRVRATDPAGNVESPAKSRSFVVDRTAPSGLSALIAGSAGLDGVPRFQITSDDPSASSRCKLDNAQFTPCSGSYKPAGAGAGLHALTIRFTDAAGNVGDQVIAFNVVPGEPPSYYEEQPAATCTVLGAPGVKGGSLRIVSARGTGRDLTVKLRAGAESLVRADVTASGKRLATLAATVRRASNTLRLRFRKQPAAGARLVLGVRFYSVKRQYGTAQLALVAGRSGVSTVPGARSVFDAKCPPAAAGRPRAGFRVSAPGAGARALTVVPTGTQPLLAELTVTRVGARTPLVRTLLVVPAGRLPVTLRLARSARLAAGRHRLGFSAINADGTALSGATSFQVR
jgi:hypothetical protein